MRSASIGEIDTRGESLEQQAAHECACTSAGRIGRVRGVHRLRRPPVSTAGVRPSICGEGPSSPSPSLLDAQLDASDRGC
jgi:hypothetical protein